MPPESANPETPVEIIAMITFAGSPEVQEQLRSLCREYIGIFSTSVRSLSAQVDPMVIEIDRRIAGQRVEPSLPVSKGDGQWRLTVDFVQLNAATRGLEGCTRNTNAARNYETYMLRSPRLHSWVSSDSPRPCVASTHRLQGSWWSIPVDTGCYGTERGWPLLSTQYAEQGPQRTCLRNLRNIHRRCTHTRQIRGGAPP
jgi:hypothetical protein